MLLFQATVQNDSSQPLGGRQAKSFIHFSETKSLKSGCKWLKSYFPLRENGSCCWGLKVNDTLKSLKFMDFWLIVWIKQMTLMALGSGVIAEITPEI